MTLRRKKKYPHVRLHYTKAFRNCIVGTYAVEFYRARKRREERQEMPEQTDTDTHAPTHPHRFSHATAHSITMMLIYEKTTLIISLASVNFVD